MKKKSLIHSFWYLFYGLFAIVLFLLFIEESPYRKNVKLLQVREVFSVGWNFFTKDPRNEITKIYYLDEPSDQWVEIGQSGRSMEYVTRITDAMQMDIYNYANQASDSVWHVYKNETELFNDSYVKNPKANYFLALKTPGRWLSKKHIKRKYGAYFMIVVAEKMPWAWLEHYNQKKMPCRSIIVKI